MYNLNYIIVIVFNCIRAYTRGYTLVCVYIYIYIYIIAEAKIKWIPTIKEVLTNRIIAHLKFRYVSLLKAVHYIVWQG